MIGVAHVSVVDHPDVSVVEDLVVGPQEELSEVLTGLQQVRQPNEGGQVTCSALQEFTSQLHFVSLLLVWGLYTFSSLNISWGRDY